MTDQPNHAVRAGAGARRRIILVIFLLTCGASRTSAALLYTSLDHPLAGPRGTICYDVDGNRIVGTYFDAAGVSHGFVYDGSTWSTLNHPDAAGPGGTAIYGVSGSKLVGTFVNAAGQTSGYVYDGTGFTTLSRPPLATGPVDTFARGIDGNTIVGYSIESLLTRGFVYDSGTFTNLVVPGAIDTFPDDINAGRIVGTYENLTGTHAFVSSGGTTSTLDHPLGELLGTFGSGVDGPNIVGTYLGLPDGSSHGFLYDGTVFTAVDFPGVTDTSVNGINGGRIVGSYNDASGVTHGFLAVVPEPSGALAVVGSVWLLCRRRSRVDAIGTTRPV